MSRGMVSFMEEPAAVGVAEPEPAIAVRGAAAEALSMDAQFVGAFGLSVVRELTWALGLAEIDEPALWEPA